MGSTRAPAVARRHLRLALRKARDARGLTQAQVAKALDWSLSKVNRIESGDVTVSMTDLQALLGLFGVSDRATIDRMTEDARAARRRGWWHGHRYRDFLTPGTIQLLQFESEATTIRTFQPTLVPGVMQTRAYADAVIGSAFGLTDPERGARLEVRVRRTEHVFGRSDPPTYLALIDESVLVRELADESVMHEQLSHVAELNSRPNVTVRIIPLQGRTMTTLGPFTLFDLGEDEIPILYQEFDFHDEVVQAATSAQHYLDIFDHLWKESLNEQASASLIQSRVAALAATLDRRSP